MPLTAIPHFRSLNLRHYYSHLLSKEILQPNKKTKDKMGFQGTRTTAKRNRYSVLHSLRIVN